MLGLVLPVILATLAGVAAGGSLSALRAQRVRWWGLGAGALLVELTLYNPPVYWQPWAIAWGPRVYPFLLLAVGVVLLRNGLGVGRRGLPWVVAAVGVGMNVLVVSANGGYMPQSESARAAAGIAPLPDRTVRLSNVKPMTAESPIAFLGDTLAQPAWLVRRNVISPGDVLLSGGIAWWALQTTLGARRPRRQAAAAAPARATDAQP